MKIMNMESSVFTPEQKDVQKKRKIYEDQTKKDARKVNTVFENLIVQGIDKEDVMRVDAKMEDDFREELKNHPDEIAHFTANLDRLQKSALTFKEKVRENPGVGERDKSTFTLGGLVSGKKVVINGQFDSPIDTEEEVIGIWRKGYRKITGKIDGEPISESLATEIVRTYFKIAGERSEKIIQAHKDQPDSNDSYEWRKKREKDEQEFKAEREKYKDIL